MGHETKFDDLPELLADALRLGDFELQDHADVARRGGNAVCAPGNVQQLLDITFRIPRTVAIYCDVDDLGPLNPIAYRIEYGAGAQMRVVDGLLPGTWIVFGDRIRVSVALPGNLVANARGRAFWGLNGGAPNVP